MLDDETRAKLKAKGWVETTAEDLFGLDEVDRLVVELRVRLAREVRRRREDVALLRSDPINRNKPGQPEDSAREADRIGSSLDELVSEFFEAGGNLEDLASVVGQSESAPR